MSHHSIIDKVKVKQSFSHAANHYDEIAVLQKNVGLDLLSRFDVGYSKSLLDLGCGTGFLTQELIKKGGAQEIIAVDLALSMLKVARGKREQLASVQYICADAADLPLANNSINIIISNLALQWCQDLAQVFSGFNQVLKQGGALMFSTFGPATLQELKSSWQKVDDYEHVNSFYTVEELNVFLQQSGFTHIDIATKQYELKYPTVLALMRELKGIGAHNVLSGRKRKLTSKGEMQRMIDKYESYRLNGLIPATYDIIFVSAKTA